MLIKKRLLTKEELKAKDMSNIFGGDNDNNASYCQCSGANTKTWCNDNTNEATHCKCSGSGADNTNGKTGCRCSS